MEQLTKAGRGQLQVPAVGSRLDVSILVKGKMWAHDTSSKEVNSVLKGSLVQYSPSLKLPE